MTGLFFRLYKAALAMMFAAIPAAALAQEQGGSRPQYGEIGFQKAATPIMDSIEAFHNGVLLWIIGAIVALVMVLLLIVMIRFNRRANPQPARFTHNTVIEVIWTVVPILILIVIAIPSFGVLADQMTTPDGQRKYLGADIFSFGDVDVPAPGLTVKVTGNQWYWTYDYVDDGQGDSVGFDSYMLNEQDRQAKKPNEPRLLAVDNDLIVPANTTVRVLVTGADVIHSFAVPSFGVKMDAVPGRVNETWFNVRKPGIYYGQCSELCGKDHAFMPIAVRVVDQDQFDGWYAELKSSGDVDSANATLPAVD